MYAKIERRECLQIGVRRRDLFSHILKPNILLQLETHRSEIFLSFLRKEIKVLGGDFNFSKHFGLKLDPQSKHNNFGVFFLSKTLWKFTSFCVTFEINCCFQVKCLVYPVSNPFIVFILN